MDDVLTTDDVLHLDRHVMVINKHSGWLSQGDRTGDAAAADLARDYLLSRLAPDEQANRNPFVAPVHRLDRPVSGVLALARTSKAARRLTSQFQQSRVTKTYLALVPAAVPDQAVVELHLAKDRRRNQVTWRSTPAPGYQQARTSLRTIVRHGELALVELQPETGRSHQLRVTLASLQAPILGDLRYGSPVALGNLLALHAFRLEFAHPVGGETVSVLAPLPDVWKEKWPWLPDNPI